MVFRKLLACKTDTASRFCIRAQRRNESLQLFLPAAILGKHSRLSEVGIVFRFGRAEEPRSSHKEVKIRRVKLELASGI
jgi:hypothetical protein